jgi:hypothetical protein
MDSAAAIWHIAAENGGEASVSDETGASPPHWNVQKLGVTDAKNLRR